jgi:hypothetical protein
VFPAVHLADFNDPISLLQIHFKVVGIKTKITFLNFHHLPFTWEPGSLLDMASRPFGRLKEPVSQHQKEHWEKPTTSVCSPKPGVLWRQPSLHRPRHRPQHT